MKFNQNIHSAQFSRGQMMITVWIALNSHVNVQKRKKLNLQKHKMIFSHYSESKIITEIRKTNENRAYPIFRKFHCILTLARRKK